LWMLDLKKGVIPQA
jgi:hypothetical protein